MRRGILQDKHSIGWRKIIFADLICLVIVVTLSFGLCYAYFSDRADMEGSSTMGVLKVMYCKNSTDTIGSASVFGSIGGDTAQELSSIAYVAPGSTLAIKGYAVNSSNFDIFVLGRLEIVITTPSEQTETEVVWYNIQNGQELYVERGRFQVGASVLYAHGVSGDKQEINAVYTFDGDKYINGYSIQSVTFEVLGHQPSIWILQTTWIWMLVTTHTQPSLVGRMSITTLAKNWHATILQSVNLMCGRRAMQTLMEC